HTFSCCCSLISLSLFPTPFLSFFQEFSFCVIFGLNSVHSTCPLNIFWACLRGKRNESKTAEKVSFPLIRLSGNMPVSRADATCLNRNTKQRRLEPLVTLDSRDYGSWRNASSPSASPSTSNKSPPVFQAEKKRVHWRK
ncbi:hypothetical protein GCK72_001024, partial [Caenorhabditis remanei]